MQPASQLCQLHITLSTRTLSDAYYPATGVIFTNEPPSTVLKKKSPARAKLFLFGMIKLTIS